MEATDLKKQSSQNFWGTPEFEQAPPPTSPPSGSAAAPGAAPAPTPAVTRAACEAGARAIVATIGVTQSMICRPLVNWKFRRKILQYMEDAEIDETMEMMLEHDKKDSDFKMWFGTLEARQQRNFNLLSELLEKREKLYGEIPFTETEKTDLIETWTEYGMATGKPMDPKVMAWLVTFGTLGKRGVSIAFS